MKFGFDIEYQRTLNEMADTVDGATLSDADLYRLGRRALHLIKRRTQRGEDAYGKKFKPYSSKYAAYRDKTGRNTSPVDLLYTGQMLAGLTAVPDRDAALLRFTNSDLGRIANYHNSLKPRSKIPLRRFLDLVEGSDEADQVAEMAADMLARTINR